MGKSRWKVGHKDKEHSNMTDLISVIIPVYNVEGYVSQCVSSVLDQTYRNIEVILVDDGSTDKSGMIVDDFARKDQRIKVIHKENGGLSDARNAGIQAAQGSYIGFVDSDDWVEPDMYEKLYHACISHQMDIASCGLFREYKDKTIAEPGETIQLDRETALRYLIDGEMLHDHAWSKLYKSDLFHSVRYPKGLLYEDIRTTYKLILRSNGVAVITEPLYHYRQRKGSIVRGTFNQNIFQMHDAFMECVSADDVSDDFGDECRRRELKIQCYIVREMLLAGRDAVEKNRHQYEKMVADIKNGAGIILGDKRFTKVYKLITLLSFFPEKIMVSIFCSGILKKYISGHYQYY